MSAAGNRRSGMLVRLLLTALVLVVVGGVGIPGVYSAFRATTANSGNTFASGTVSISDNDSGTTALSLSSAQPGATDTACVKVSYGGSLPATVRLHGATTGTGLDQYLDLNITRGTYNGSEPGFDSCTNFQADSTDYIGKGAGVVYDNTLQSFPDDYAGGLVDPTSGSASTWTNGTSRVYRIQVTLRDNTGAQGKTAGQTFTWEARNQ